MLVYTNIQHKFRIENKLTCNEYILCDMIYMLSRESGWCHASKEYLADQVGLSRRSVINLINKLTDTGFLIKEEKTMKLRATNKWSDVYFNDKLGVKKVRSRCEDSSQLGCEESSHNNNIVYNNRYNKENIKRNSDTSASPPFIENSSSLTAKKSYTQEHLDIFEQFRKSYEGTKRGTEVEFLVLHKHKDWQIVLPQLQDKINKYKIWRLMKQKNGEFVPMWKNLRTWLNQRCWEEEYEPVNIPKQKMVW